MALTGIERRVCEAIEAGTEELVELASALIAFDTTARSPGDPPRDEAALQNCLAEILDSAGAEVDLFEPSAYELSGRPLVPPGLDFADRPQLIATQRAPSGHGRSLIFNGHIDAVSPEPRDNWATDPFEPQIRDGKLYGRGACDMKGGVAAMVFALQKLAETGTRLAGDLIVATNTDEESSGAGGAALVHRGLHASAAIVPEPTGFDVWIACRGSEYCTINVPGRAGHAEVRQPPWQEGGAVNAIEKAGLVLEAIQTLRQQWERRRGFDHPYLSPPSLLATMVRSGEWPVTYPSSCEVTVAVMYLPVQADDDGWGSAVREEVERWITRGSETDPWLTRHPPTFEWWPNHVMPSEVSPSEPVVSAMLQATRDVNRPGTLSGLDSWYDGATLTRFAGIPAIGYGPPGFDANGTSVAHTVDEYVPIDGLVSTAQALAIAAMRFCGTA